MLVGAVALSIGLAACGGDDGGGGEAAGSPATGARADEIVACLKDSGHPDAAVGGSRFEGATTVELDGFTTHVFETEADAAASAKENPSVDPVQVGDAVMYTGFGAEPADVEAVRACL